MLFRGSELRCQAAVVDHFGRDAWFGDEGAVLRGGEGDELPVVIGCVRAVPKPATCALCHERIVPAGSGLSIDGLRSQGLYHAGECHSQAVVMLLLERERDEEVDEREQRRAELAERFSARGH